VTTDRVQFLILVLTATLFALVIGLAGCYCWTPAHKDEAKCKVVSSVVDCTAGSVKDIAPSVAAIVLAYLANAAPPDWPSLLTRLEGLGLDNAGCILAMIEADFQRPGATPGRMALAQDTHAHVLAWAVAKNLNHVTYKVAP
jgi:hypothetical protein